MQLSIDAACGSQLIPWGTQRSDHDDCEAIRDCVDNARLPRDAPRVLPCGGDRRDHHLDRSATRDGSEVRPRYAGGGARRGSIHGLVFITYALTAALVGVNQHWPSGRITFAVATAIIPYATIPFDRHLERKNLLDGEWRRTVGDDPRDHTAISRLLRWFLVRPAMLASIFVAAVLVIMTVMLIIGPPGGWK